MTRAHKDLFSADPKIHIDDGSLCSLLHSSDGLLYGGDGLLHRIDGLSDVSELLGYLDHRMVCEENYLSDEVVLMIFVILDPTYHIGCRNLHVIKGGADIIDILLLCYCYDDRM